MKLLPIFLLRPGQLVSTDLCGPFPKTERDNTYALIITDCFAKLLAIIPIKDKETATFVKAIVDEWICIYGIPEAVLSDQGKEFRSKLWDAVCEYMDIERIHTVPYHPECNGNAEKNVQQTKRMTRAYIEADHKNWDI